MPNVINRRASVDLTFPVEAPGVRRDRRREALFELDGLLAQLEEINVRGAPVPGWVRLALARHGIACRPRTRPPQLIEAIFSLQEHYLLQPEHRAARRERESRPPTVRALRRRIA